MKEKIKLRIAIYSRKSKYTDKGDSIGNQIEIAKEYIKLHYPDDIYDIEIIVYEDEGFSGKSFDRPKFREFLKDEREKPYNILICYRLDRISRNIADFSNLINELSQLETSFVSIKEQFDTKTPMGRAMMYIASVFAQLEREVIAERVRDNLLELAKTGTWLGGDPPTGFKTERYKKDIEICEEDEFNNLVKKNKKASKLTLYDDELPKVLLIFRKYQELKSLTQLETYLMNANIKSRNNVYYSINALREILTNITYAKNDMDIINYLNSKGIHVYAEKDGREKFDGNYGFLSYNKRKGNKWLPIEKWIIAVGLHPGIISGKEWVNVQMILERNASKSYRAVGHPKKQSIASGLIRCKECGSYMKPRNTGTFKSDGTINYNYYCILKEKSRGQKCSAKNVKGNLLDEKIFEILKDTFVPNSEIYQELKKISIQKCNGDNSDELLYLQSEYNKINEQLDKLIEKLKYIDLDLIDMVNQELRKLKEKKNKLEEEIRELKNNKKSISKIVESKTASDILKILDNCFNIFNDFDLKTKRDISNLFIESIYGNGDEVVINLLKTTIEENKKKLFIPTVQIVDNFSKPNLPTERGCVNRHSSRCIYNI